jgi:hypothetical protein
MNLVGVPSHEVEEIWDEIEPLVSAACCRSFPKRTVSDVLEAVQKRDMQLWLAAEEKIYAVIITEIMNYPLRNVCRVVIATGTERRRWQHFIATIEQWAKAQGCQSMELVARPGWKKIFRDYTLTHIHLEKELKHGTTH